MASNNSMASRDSDGGSDGDHSVMDHQIQEVSFTDKKFGYSAFRKKILDPRTLRIGCPPN